MPEDFEIKFVEETYAPVRVQGGAELSTVLDASNSPVLFGCRIGICGSCLIEVDDDNASPLPVAEAIEAESLGLYAPENPKARLACQLRACGNICIKKIR